MKRGRKISTVAGFLKAVVDDVDYLLANGVGKKRVVLDMGDWVVASPSKCKVCFAGAYLVNNTGAKLGGYDKWHPSIFDFNTEELAYALNGFRVGLLRPLFAQFYGKNAKWFSDISSSIYRLQNERETDFTMYGEVSADEWKVKREKIMNVIRYLRREESKVRKELGLTSKYEVAS